MDVIIQPSRLTSEILPMINPMPLAAKVMISTHNKTKKKFVPDISNLKIQIATGSAMATVIKLSSVW